MRCRKTCAVALGLLLATSLLHAAQSYEVTMEKGVTATMRDGVILRADIYRPKADGQFPVLLQRTPYNKSGGTAFAIKAAATGYVVIIQDVRGRYTSDGDWYTFKHESNDGYDTVEWAATLPYSNGKVGMWGGSYVGATQMLAAIAHPPHLAGICPIVTASNYHENWTYQGGAFEQWFNQSWTSGLAQDTVDRSVAKNTNALGGAWKLPLASYPLFNFSDPSAAPISTATLAPYFLDWLAHPTYDQYWKQISIEEHFGDINVPMLSIVAWYDIFQGGSLRNYIGIKAHGGSEAARKGQHLFVTIGGHAGSGRKIGEVDFGPAAAEFDESELTLKWYDYLFKGVQNEFAGKPVKIFVMGANQWREEDDWPLARAQSTKYFLHSSKGANSLDRNRQITSSMIHRIPCPRSADLCVAIRSIWRPVPAINVRSRPVTTY
jgi:putative CocE/NonD family hydrolase